MSELIVVAFDRFEDAKTAMRLLRDLERDQRVGFEDTAIVERAPDGKVHVKNEISGATEKGAGIGALVGGFVMFFFPVAGIALGAAAGAGIGALLHKGVSREFETQVKDQLEPGKSALFLVVRDGSEDAVVAALGEFDGEVLQTTLPSDVEADLRQALAHHH